MLSKNCIRVSFFLPSEDVQLLIKTCKDEINLFGVDKLLIKNKNVILFGFKEVNKGEKFCLVVVTWQPYK